MNPNEEVRCVNAKDIEDWLVPGFILRPALAILSRLRRLDTVFVERKECETDPSYKQLIPYTVIQWNGALLYYQRREGGDRRLQGRKSIGYGGHVDLADGLSYGGELSVALFQAVERELEEELVWPDEHSPSFWSHLVPIGTIFEPLTQVGCVHFGIVFLWTWVTSTEESLPRSNTPEHTDPQLLLYSERQDLSQFEVWSQYLLGEAL